MDSTAARLFDALMACETVEDLDTIARSEILGNPVARVDVSELLTLTARVALDIRAGVYSLGALAHVLRTYTDEARRAPAVRLDGEVA